MPRQVDIKVVLLDIQHQIDKVVGANCETTKLKFHTEHTKLCGSDVRKAHVLICLVVCT